jgi:hypothetical protein
VGKSTFFVMALPHSDALFLQAFERECTETFWEGHVRGFASFGGVPRRITYHNSRVMAARIVGPRQRQLTRGFLQLKSHYLFDQHFCLEITLIQKRFYVRPSVACPRRFRADPSWSLGPRPRRPSAVVSP